MFATHDACADKLTSQEEQQCVHATEPTKSAPLSASMSRSVVGVAISTISICARLLRKQVNAQLFSTQDAMNE